MLDTAGPSLTAASWSGETCRWLDSGLGWVGLGWGVGYASAMPLSKLHPTQGPEVYGPCSARCCMLATPRRSRTLSNCGVFQCAVSFHLFFFQLPLGVTAHAVLDGALLKRV